MVAMLQSYLAANSCNLATKGTRPKRPITAFWKIAVARADISLGRTFAIWGGLMSDKKPKVLWPERFRVPAMDEDEADAMAREVVEWDAYLAEQPHIKRLLQELRALPGDELHYIQRAIFGSEGPRW
jgi:hypothetical protein